MYKFRRFQTTITGNKWVGPQYLREFLPRQPVGHLKRLPPQVARQYNKSVKEPEALKYKLYTETDSNWEVPLGDTSMLPFQV